MLSFVLRRLLGGSFAKALAVAAMTSAVSSPARAAIVWNTYDASLDSAYLAISAAVYTNAQAFTLNQATDLTQFAWSGAYNGPAPASDSFTIDIYAKTAGQPSNAPLASLAAGTANRSLSSERLFGAYDLYEYNFAPSASLVLEGGDYFFAVNSNAGNWYWGVATNTAGRFFVRGGMGPWEERVSTMAFRIEGNAVPEPASLALAGAGLLGMFATRRRQRG